MSYTSTGVSTVYTTIGRSIAVPSSFNTTNLSASGGLINSNSLVLAGYNMARVANPSPPFTGTLSLSVVDTPLSAGTYYYSLWGASNGSPFVTNTENVMLTIMKILP
jgi:hypothetical protein